MFVLGTPTRNHSLYKVWGSLPNLCVVKTNRLAHEPKIRQCKKARITNVFSLGAKIKFCNDQSQVMAAIERVAVYVCVL